MRIRPAVVTDAEAVLEIYNAEVLGSIATFDLVPRSIEEQRAWITDRSGAHAVLICEDENGVICGFGALSPYRDRSGYSTTVEDSVYVHADHRGKGLGRLILDAVVETARAHGFHAVMAKIAGGHQVSIDLHLAAGFDIVGREREVGRKFGKWLDVVLMEQLLS
jgi:L-amino acid N-acyltransferase YncA